MASKLGPYNQTASAAGAVNIPFVASPVGGFNAVATLDTATAASIELQVRVGADWLVADTLDLNAGNPSDNIPVFAIYEAARWNVLSVTGGQVKLDTIGVGV